MLSQASVIHLGYQYLKGVVQLGNPFGVLRVSHNITFLFIECHRLLRERVALTQSLRRDTSSAIRHQQNQ